MEPSNPEFTVDHVEWKWHNNGRENHFTYLQTMTWQEEDGGENIAAAIIREWIRDHHYDWLSNYTIEILSPERFKGIYAFYFDVRVTSYRVDQPK